MSTPVDLIKGLSRAMLARSAEANVPGPHRRAGPLKAGDEVTMADDGFHFQNYADHDHKLFYVEWWYYNFQDTASGLSGMVTFAVCNPGNELDLGTASLNMAVFTPEGDVLTRIDFMHVTHFAATPDSADVTIGASSVVVKDADTYLVKARCDEGDIEMDLEFRREGPSQLLADRVPGYAAWEVSSWLVYMAGARVSGRLMAKGTEYDLKDAKGYHDHDWGIWMLPERIWSWAQFSTPDHKIAFDVGFHAAFQKSTAYMRFGEEQLYFPQDKFEVTQDDWQSWWYFWKYPGHVAFDAVNDDGTRMLELEWTVTATSTLWKYPLIVHEQACGFTGRLRARDPATGAPGELLATIETPGFCEYTNRWVGGD